MAENNNRKNKKIGIINHWQVNNYGALLLAYALEKTVLKLGYDVETISYLPDEVKYPWKTSIIKKIGFRTYIMRLIYFMIFIIPRHFSFSNFRDRMVTSTSVYNDKTICKLKDKYDKIIIGGDQLWNCKINYYNENNFLPFIKEKEKKVVYAASIAQDKMREDLVDTFRELASDFYYITTREKRAKEIIKEITGINADRVVDPAFLLSSTEWENLAAKDGKVPDNFIFVYQVQSDTELIEFAQKLAKDKNCYIVYCPFPLKKQIKCKRKPYISPEKWLYYIKNSRYVVTDAFHGTVFSIIFNKPFFSQISSYGKDTGSRITNLLEVFSLENRLLVDGKCDYINENIDYCRINKLIVQERNMSLEHLSSMLQ
ncbi:MAG: hypothetical protein K0R54_1683 [Clostridiaceae bacterium]|jgi:hypothetical protein|nr:hypothetical protein [Clostridiaceae bacterium]